MRPGLLLGEKMAPGDAQVGLEFLAARCDDDPANYCGHLGIALYAGAVAVDYEMASHVLERACEVGDWSGCFNLARLIRSGKVPTRGPPTLRGLRRRRVTSATRNPAPLSRLSQSSPGDSSDVSAPSASRRPFVRNPQKISGSPCLRFERSGKNTERAQH
ncbi:MAG: hypothetical protein Q8N23_27830 [Archangium sp.]|nr:hypothetical protein [Archangium sp.]